MAERLKSWIPAALPLAALGLLLVLPAPAAAHVTKASGPYRVSFGWGVEPPIAGFQNFVEVGVAGASGAPVSGGSLQAQVSFGDTSTTLPLVPDEEAGPGALRADIVPTRPGTYSMRISGRVQRQQVDVSASCSPKTFDCVDPASDIEFPVKDPSLGELAQRVSRELPRAERSDSDSGEGIAIAALILAALALAGVVGLAVSARRKSG